MPSDVLQAFAAELEQYRQTIAHTPATRAELESNLDAWWRRARGVALDVGTLLPPLPPGPPMTPDAHGEYLDRLHRWALTAAPASRLRFSTAVATYLAATLRPSVKDRAITPTGYLDLVDELDRARGADLEGGHAGA